MADEAKIGTPWRDDELDAIVADYFAMLDADLSRRPYVKAKQQQGADGAYRPDAPVGRVQAPEHLSRAG